MCVGPTMVTVTSVIVLLIKIKKCKILRGIDLVVDHGFIFQNREMNLTRVRSLVLRHPGLLRQTPLLAQVELLLTVQNKDNFTCNSHRKTNGNDTSKRRAQKKAKSEIYVEKAFIS